MAQPADDHVDPGADRSPRRRDAAATRARLLEAARELFLRQGFRATGLRQVAARAGVDVTLVRRYFGSKQQLFAEATDITGDLAAILDAPDSEVGQRLLVRVLRARRDIDAPVLALLRSSGDPAVVARLKEQFEDAITQPLATRISADHPRLRADMVTALLIGIGVLRALLNKEPMTTADDREIEAVFTEAFQVLTRLVQNTPSHRSPRAKIHGRESGPLS
jgi:AcrR family transcriptional regulator